MNPPIKPCARTSVVIAVLMLACVTAFLTVAPRAHAAAGMEVAVQDDNVFLYQLPIKGYSNPQAKTLDLVKRLQATWVRANVDWYYVVLSSAKKKKPPKNIKYNWSGFDFLITAASQRGQHVQLTLNGSAPAWATGNKKPGVFRPSPSRFAQFAHDAAEHFRGRVSRYSIWNESNYADRLAPKGAAPSLYRSLYGKAYTAIKKVDPTAQVLFGETSPEKLARITAPLAFLRAVTCAKPNYTRARNCPTLKTDGYAHHPYDYRHSPDYVFPGSDNVTLKTIGRLTTALAKLQAAGLLTTPSGGVPDVYGTEYGYFSSGKYKLSPQTQGQYLVRAFSMAQANPRIRQLTQYLVIKPPSKYLFFDTSIAGRKGQPTAAFNMLANWAQGAANSGQIARLGGTAGGPPEPPPGGGPPPPGCGLPGLPICPPLP
jgi:hypothetical protein